MATSDKLKTLQQLLLQIPQGKTTTYKEISRAMGTKGYRAIGQLLHKNPEPDQFPCFKVVRSDGALGGFAMGQKDKIRRLRADGIEVSDGKVIDFDRILYRFG
jgi:methylated-DNA-[protein]-cysteine S-methyltransferase